MPRSVFLASVAATFLATSVFAQGTTTSNYAEVRGWTVVSTFTDAGFTGCFAASQGSGNALSIAYVDGGWQVWVPSTRNDGSTYDGGLIAVDDRQPVDSQFGFFSGGTGGFANVSEQMIDWIGQGSTLRTRINGENEQVWSLSGSAAAIGKIRECVDMMGNTDS